MDFFEGMAIADVANDKFGPVAGNAIAAMALSEDQKQKYYQKVNEFWHNVQASNINQSKKDEIYNLCNDLISTDDQTKKNDIVRKINDILK